jgi:hypothetical protein
VTHQVGNSEILEAEPEVEAVKPAVSEPAAAPVAVADAVDATAAEVVNNAAPSEVAVVEAAEKRVTMDEGSATKTRSRSKSRKREEVGDGINVFRPNRFSLTKKFVFSFCFSILLTRF